MLISLNLFRIYKQYRTKMATYAKQVEQYELDCPFYQNKAEQRAKNAKIAEECMVYVMLNLNFNTVRLRSRAKTKPLNYLPIRLQAAHLKPHSKTKTKLN